MLLLPILALPAIIQPTTIPPKFAITMMLAREPLRFRPFPVKKKTPVLAPALTEPVLNATAATAAAGFARPGLVLLLPRLPYRQPVWWKKQRQE